METPCRTWAEYWLAIDWLSSALCCGPAAPPLPKPPLLGGGLPIGVACPLEAASGLPTGVSPPLLLPVPLLLSTRPTTDRTARTRDGDTLRLPGGLMPVERPLVCFVAGPLPA